MKYKKVMSIILALGTLLLIACTDKKVEESKSNVQIEVKRDGNIVAEGLGEVKFGKYEAGDIIKFTSNKKYISVKISDNITETTIYIPNGTFEFTIPAGNDAKVFKEGTFTAAQNVIEAKKVSDEDLSKTRNIALNPLDYRYESEITKFDAKKDTLPIKSTAVTNGEVQGYPHAYANRITRNEAQFYARNAIDGVNTLNAHGYYPAHSWGGGLYDDLLYTVYFGREVIVSKIALALRSDFKVSGGKEHDTYWDEITVEFSDGSTVVINPTKTGEYQEFKFDNVVTTSVTLKNLKRNNDTPSEMYAALNEIQVWGK